jgi:fucose permease
LSPLQTPAIPRQQLFLAFAVFILIGLYDSTLGTLLPNIRDAYHLDAATVSTIFLFGSGGYMLASFNTGLLVRLLGMYRFLLTGIGIMFLGTIILASYPPYWAIILIGASLISFGVGIIDAGLNAYLASFPENGSSLNYLHAFYGVGALLGPAIVSALLVAQLSWNSAYLLWSIVVIVILGGFWFLYRTGSSTEMAQSRTTGDSIFRLRVVWLAAFCLLTYVGTEVSLGSWSFTFLKEFRQLPVLFAGWTVSGYWAGLTLGRMFLARRVLHIGEVRAISECLAGTMFGLVLCLIIPTGVGIAAGLCCVGFFLGPIFPTVIALISRRVPPPLLAGSVGFITSFASIGGAFFPWLAGHVIQWTSLAAFLPYVMIVALLLTLLLSYSSHFALQEPTK